MSPVIPTFLIGLVVGPMVKKFAKPALKGVIKTTASLAMEVKRTVAEATEELQDFAAEVTAEMVVADVARDKKPSHA